MRRLIVNADDFGLTTGINRAIVEAHENGIVSSATLMANAAKFDEAAAHAQRSPQLGVGCHVMLVDGTPLRDPATLPTLARDGQFASQLSGVALRAWTGRISSSEVEHEVAAQLGKLREAGIAVTHVDTHKHTHVLPAILRPLLRAARQCGVRAVRNPFEPAWCTAVSQPERTRLRSFGVRLLDAFRP